MMQFLWKTAWQFLERLNIELPNDLAISLLGTDPTESIHPHKNLYVNVHNSSIHHSEKVETQMSINR